MAGAAFTTTVPRVIGPDMDSYLGSYVVKTSEIINNGDLVGVDTSGLLVVASKTAGSVVVAIGVGLMTTDHSGAQSVTGDGTKTMQVYRNCRITGLNSTLVPSLTKQGLAVMLGPVSTATVSNYTCAIPTTNTDEVQAVGVSVDATTIDIQVTPPFMKAQTTGNSTLTQG